MIQSQGWRIRLPALAAGVFSAVAVVWCMLVDLETGPVEACRTLVGLVGLWLPVGSLVYLALRGRCSDGLTRWTLSASASYGLTAPLYALCGAVGLGVPGFQQAFYLLQAALLVGCLAYVLHRKRVWARADLLDAWRRVDWLLVGLIALSMLTTSRYKQIVAPLPDQNFVRVIPHGDTTYLASLAYELGRRTPAEQQSMRAGLKERAYHMFPHLTAMLIARYAGQPDILRAVTHYQFTVVEILLALIFFCTVRRLTGSRAAGYLAVALVYVLAIPLPPMGPHLMTYFYFTLLPHSSSTLEPSVLCSPQMYCALPVVLATLLCVLECGAQTSREAGALAIVAGLQAAVLLRFRVQVFVILFPGLLLLWAWLGWRTRQRVFWLAGCLAALVVGVQAIEMQLPVYYPATARLELGDNHLALDIPFFSAWPGAGELRDLLQRNLSPTAFRRTWQIVCLSSFGLLNIAGIPCVIAATFYSLRRRSWQPDAWAYSAIIVWLTAGTAIGSTCLSTSYDRYSIGGEALFLLGWYLLPCAAAGAWVACRLTADACSSRVPVLAPLLSRGAVAAAVVTLLAAGVWQRVRPESLLQAYLATEAGVLPAEEWAALAYMRDHLPPEAVLLTKTTHHPKNACILSGLAGRKSYLEYFGMGGPLGGSASDQWAPRQARIDRLWSTENPAEFAAYVLDTGATHLVEYSEHPLQLHSSDCLEAFWSSPSGQVKVWALRTAPGAREAYREVRRRIDPDGVPFRAF